MRRRAKRCPQCLIPEAFCVCSLVPPETTRTQVSVVIHYSDVERTTNTGKWVPVALAQGKALIRGRKEEPLDITEALHPDCHNLMLFPSADSQPLTPEFVSNIALPINLIVPDGNWNQAVKMEKREPKLDQVPRVHLLGGQPSRYRLRTAAHPEWVSTFEAVARALGVIENPDIQKRLEYFFDVAVERVLFLKGELPREQVTGGISKEMIHKYHTDNNDQAYIDAQNR